jgi:murein DD-endopeptidase MepM/ murein hydrolase activator NlpD
VKVQAETRRRARTFGIGAASGFVAGVALVGIVVSKYGGVAAVPEHAAQAAHAVRADDGMADVDTPALVQGTAGRYPAPVPAPPAAAAPPATADVPPSSPVAPAASVEELRRRALTIPVEGIKPDQLVDSFTDARSGARVHEALDILAPRNTPVKAVEDGAIARLFFSKAGGITIYQFDPTEQFCYYYAHLERYADGLQEGQKVERGQVLGYVGTTGNAPRDTPHLHFAVFRLTAAKHWWEGTPIDPYPILR